jgi:hypothetical protein
MADEKVEHDCRFTGPDSEGFFWLQRTETNGAFGIINLGCCDEDDILSAMVKVLEEKGWIELVRDQTSSFQLPVEPGNN